MTNDLVCVGVIAGAYGVRGLVRLKSFCAEPRAIANYGPLSDETGGRSFSIVALGPAVAGGFAARLFGVETREQAAALRGTRLYVPRAVLPEPDDDEFYHADLLDLPVYDRAGIALGRVVAVWNHGAGDILEVRAPKGKTLLFPFTRQVVTTIDLKGGRIVVDPPDEI